MERVVVAMSGGVDSSVAAALLREQGLEVIGVTMLVWSPPGVDMNQSDSCCGLPAAEDARRVCARLGIRHYTLDFRDLFYDSVVREYVDEYLHGRTPNPCIRCNERVKFGALLARARELGAERLATGHYARVRRDDARARWLLLRGRDARRDQSYALYRLSQEQLSRTLFPVGELQKREVRERAEELGLPTAGKPDSQETCFVPNNDYPELLRILAPEAVAPGEIRDREGRLLGRHDGTAFYTIGQRRRINVGSPRPLYVSAIDPARRTVTVAPAGDPALARTEVWTADANLLAWDEETAVAGGAMPVAARVRYNSAWQPAVLTVHTGPGGIRLHVRFHAPVRAVTPGQSLVCYRGEEVVAGGVIAGEESCLPPAASEGGGAS